MVWSSEQKKKLGITEETLDDFFIGLQSSIENMTTTKGSSFTPESLKLPKITNDQELEDFIKNKLYITKAGQRIEIKVFPAMVKFIGDFFFGREKLGIIWKGRGTSGSLSVSILIWMMMVYKHLSFVDLSGSKDQSMNVYNYTKEFWDCHEPSKRIIDGDPLMSLTKLVDGTYLSCVTASDKSARGKHPNGLIIDEACILPDTKIFTNKGLLEIKNVVEGDLVISSNGKLNKINKKWAKYWDGSIVEIKSKKGDVVSVTHDHKVLVRRKSENIWVESLDMMLSDLLPIPKLKQQICSDRKIYVEELSGKNFKKSIIREINYSEDLFYFFGAWCGNGSASKSGKGTYRVVLHNHIDKIKCTQKYCDIVENIFGKRPKAYNSPSRGKCADIKINHKGLFDFIKLNLKSHKDKGLPVEILMSATDGEIKSFIKGLMDTDGHLMKRKDGSGKIGGYTHVTISDKIALSLFYSLMRLGILPSINKKETWRYEVQNNDQIITRFYGEKSHELFGVDNVGKNTQIFEEDENFIYIPIISLTKKYYQGPIYDIEIEEQHDFLANYAILHNCQSDAGSDEIFSSALQMVMSEKDYIIIMLSTFHVPTGFFQSYWDHADERGFKKYKWDCYDAAEKCDLPIDCKDCFLTEKEDIISDGQKIKQVYTGCNGKARNSKGFLPIRNLIAAKKINEGNDTFAVEFECRRPKGKGLVYSIEDINNSLVKVKDTKIEMIPRIEGYKVPMSVGIDWGLVGQTAVVGAMRRQDDILIPFSYAFTGRPTATIIEKLKEIQKLYGDFIVYADASHPFNNFDVHAAGFVIESIAFNKWKGFGIENVEKYFRNEKLKIIEESNKILIDQHKRYARDENGKPIKKHDHMNDSLLSYLDGRVKVLTSKGWEKISKLKVGDLVLTHKKRFRKITAYKPTPYKKENEVVVIFKGPIGTACLKHVVTLEHPFLLSNGNWVEAENLKQGDKIKCLANKCKVCGEKTLWHRITCEKCKHISKNMRWEKPTAREEKEREYKRQLTLNDYRTGKKDRMTNTKKAVAAWTKKINEDPVAYEKLRQHLISNLSKVNTPEKCKKQSALMRSLHKREGFFDHLRTKERRKFSAEQAVRNIKKYGCKLKHCREDIYNNLEEILKNEFDKNKINYKHNFNVGKWFVDFAFPEHKIAIECDEHFHKIGKNVSRDITRDENLKELGWQVIRLEEDTIRNNTKKCVEEVIRVIGNHDGDYLFTEIEVDKVEIRKLKKPKLAFHFEVEEDKSYIAKGIVSHNCAMLHFIYLEEFPVYVEETDSVDNSALLF